MRKLGAALLLLTTLGPAAAQTPREVAPRPPVREPAEPAKPDPNRAGREAARRSTLDDLYARLEAAADAEEAKGVAGLILRRLQRSGSDTADLLLARSGEAMTANDAPLAIELLDRVTQIKPDWAEAWSRRGVAFQQLDDPVRAISDLRQALAREPRHFAAWAALGQMEMAGGDKKAALAAFRRALKLHPFLEQVRTAVERLAPEIDGRDL